MTAAEVTTPPMKLPGVDQWSVVRQLHTQATTDPGGTAIMVKRFGRWDPLTWNDHAAEVSRVADGLVSTLGRVPGAVAILSANRPEWVTVDLAAQAVGAMAVGIYPTNSPEQVAYVIDDCRADVVFVDDEEQYDKILDSNVECIALIITGADVPATATIDPRAVRYSDLVARGADTFPDTRAAIERLGALCDVIEPDDVAMLVYTSGTTGAPKGAMLSHRNLHACMYGWAALFPFRADDTIVSYLPLCHVLERNLSVVTSVRFGQTVLFGEPDDTVFALLYETAPTLLAAVPRIWEKLHQAHTLRLDESARPFQRLTRWAIRVGYEHRNPTDGIRQPSRLAAAIADRFVLSAIRDQLGLRRVRVAMSGGAPISPELLRFFDGIGVPIREAYGSTEIAGLIAVHPEHDVRFGTVGEVIPGLDVRIGVDDEIQMRGPGVFAGYFGRTDPVVDADGWFGSGDQGSIVDGQLAITGRLKDLIITAGGKNISPSEIENELKTSAFIDEAVVIGDSRKFLSALIQVDSEQATTWAQREGVVFTTYESLMASDEMVAKINAEIDTINNGLARAEQIKTFRLFPTLLDEDDGEVTATRKIRRSVIAERYSDLIDTMYGATR